MAGGDIDGAMNNFEQSRKLRKDLFDEYGHDPEHALQYSRGLRNFGFMARDFGKDLLGAIKKLKIAKTIQENLADEFKEVERFKYELGATCNVLAEMYLFACLNDPAGAEDFDKLGREAARQAETIFGEFYQSIMKTSERLSDHRALFDFARSQVTLACFDRIADPTNSIRLARGVEERMLDDFSSASLMDRDELVTLAFARSLQGKLEMAFEALNNAVNLSQDTVFRFEMHKKLALKAIAEDPIFGPKFDELLVPLRQRIRDNSKSKAD